VSAPFVHHLRPRYAEIDLQGVVFNAHWLTYFDEASTRFFAVIRDTPAQSVFSDFDVMVVKATLEWEGPARFDDDVAVEVVPSRIGNASFDLTYTATVEGRGACVGVITYVSVTPGTHDSTPIPERIRASLEERHVPAPHAAR
jgi:acyl-CoA thioester hydrolase